MPSKNAELAETVLKSLGMWRIPVDPFAIAKKEGIFLCPDNYGDSFDGRIEYYPDFNEFCLFHQQSGQFRSEERVRFTIAHELGHFYLPEHRNSLKSLDWHNCITDFTSRDPRESEADEFAADLLMPMELFRRELDRFRQGWCDLDDLFTLSKRLGASRTSTARRYCESDREGCTIFFSMNGVILWNSFSQDMKYLEMYYYPFNQPAPPGSKTADYWQQINSGCPPEKLAGRVSSEVWFDWPKCDYIWEEVTSLGTTGRAITQISPDR